MSIQYDVNITVERKEAQHNAPRTATTPFRQRERSSSLSVEKMREIFLNNPGELQKYLQRKARDNEITIHLDALTSDGKREISYGHCESAVKIDEALRLYDLLKEYSVTHRNFHEEPRSSVFETIRASYSTRPTSSNNIFICTIL